MGNETNRTAALKGLNIKKAKINYYIYASVMN